MSQETMTYGELDKKLATFGYSATRRTIEDKPTRIYKHESIEEATMYIPDGGDGDPVHPVMLGKVLLILKTHGLYEEKNPLLA